MIFLVAKAYSFYDFFWWPKPIYSYITVFYLNNKLLGS